MDSRLWGRGPLKVPAPEKISSIFTNINSPCFWINCDSSVTGEQPLARFWSTGRFHKSTWKANKRLCGTEVTGRKSSLGLIRLPFWPWVSHSAGPEAKFWWVSRNSRVLGWGSSLPYSFPFWVVSMHLIYSCLPWGPQLSPDPKDWNSTASTAQRFNFLRVFFFFFFWKAASWTVPVYNTLTETRYNLQSAQSRRWTFLQRVSCYCFCFLLL